MTEPGAHRARKRFGQNFLHDPAVIARIVNAINPRPTETLVEIGPGLGALTRPLLDRLPHLHVIELDRDLAARLRAGFSTDRVTVHEIDALRQDYCQLRSGDAKIRAVGNLPYNISSPLLFHLLDQAPCIADMTFMLQKEVVDRLAARPDTTDYGRLTVMVQSRAAVEPLFDVGPGAFKPAPRVVSSVVRLVPHAVPPVEIRDAVVFAAVVRAAFAHRRKTLRNNLAAMLTADQIRDTGIDPQRRAETLSIAEFAKLSERTQAG